MMTLREFLRHCWVYSSCRLGNSCCAVQTTLPMSVQVLFQLVNEPVRRLYGAPVEVPKDLWPQPKGPLVPKSIVHTVLVGPS